MSNLSISKIEVKNGCIYTKLQWEPNSAELFKIQIFDDNGSWSGSFSYDSATQCREAFEIESEEQYKSNVKVALSGVSDLYVYDFDVNKGVFKWKKKFPDSVIVEHGRVLVQRDDVATPVHTLMDILLQQNHSLISSIGEYTRNHESVLLELERCKRELDTFIDTKISLEETIYGKFIQLLNEKKKRILMLDDALKAME